MSKSLNNCFLEGKQNYIVVEDSFGAKRTFDDQLMATISMLSSLFISKTSQNSLKVTTSKESSHPNEQNALVLYNRDLSFDSRSNAFQTLLKWLTENPLKFGAEVSDMLRNAVENNFLHQISFPWEAVYKKINSTVTICKGHDYKLPNNQKQIEHKISVKRLSDLLAIDSTGNSQYGSMEMERYCQKENKWIVMGKLPAHLHRSGCGIELVDNKLIFIGGMDPEQQQMNLVWSYDLTTKEAKPLQSMHKSRYIFTTLTMGGYIYAIGGLGLEKKLEESVERYHIKSNTWSMRASMSMERSYHTCVKLSGQIYVMGGTNRDGIEHNSVECYDPINDQWTTLAPMNRSRAAFKAIVSSGYIYVIGGDPWPINMYATIERFDPKNNTWTMMNFQLEGQRINYGVSVFQGFVILAGLGAFNDAKKCEKIDLKTGKRSDFPSLLAKKKECHLLVWKGDRGQ